MIDKVIIVILERMLILSEYPNDKRAFILFTSITASFANYKHVVYVPRRTSIRV